MRRFGASYTSNPSYQAAVPSSSGYHGSYVSPFTSSSSYETSASSSSGYHGSYVSPFTSNASYQAAVQSSSNHSVSSNKSLTLKKPHSHSVRPHLSNYPNPDFIQLLPVSTQFPNPQTVPKSMKNMSISDQVVNFYPVKKKGPNYLQYCIGCLSDEEKPSSIRDCIWQYTSGSNWYCTEVNMALASDSPKLKSYGSYIKQLKYSIGMSQMRFAGTVFRGADMSPSEIQAYETQNIFFIPSFTSTSKSMPFKNKNTLFHIDITPEWSKFCMEIQPAHTKYAAEEEILFSCYNLYQYQRTEKSNGQRIIKLTLMNYNKYFNYRANTIVNYHV
ncbi:hypothetical protein I4U23_005374 [Adineta vaga]|nr:hypothetical protein I4U23_005374 [Adineta vaga]